MADQKTLQLPSGKVLALPPDTTPEQAQRFYEQAVGMDKGGGDPQSQEGWFSKATGFVGDQLGTLFSDMGRGIQKNFIEPTRIIPRVLDDFTSPSNPLQGVKNVGVDIWNLLNGIGQASLEGMRNSNYRPLERVISAVPGVGPQIAQTGHEPIGEGLVDSGAVLAQLFGPEGMKGVLDRTTVPAGRALVRGAFPVDDSLPLRMQRAVLDKVEQAGIVPRHGEAVFPEMAKAQGLIDEGMTNVNNIIAAYQGGPVKTVASVAPIIDIIWNYYKAGIGEEAAPLEAALKNYFQAHTGIPPQKGETAMQYVSRAAQQDPGSSLGYWQEVKQALGRVEKETNAVKTKGELAESGTSKSVFHSLMEKGLREKMRELAPEIDKWNAQASAGIRIREELDKLSRKDPSKLAQLLPLVTGGTVGAGIAALGLHYGSVPLEFAGGYGLGSIARMITIAAMRDPVTMVRVGTQLKNWGYTPWTRPVRVALENYPKLRAVQPNQSPEQ